MSQETPDPASIGIGPAPEGDADLPPLPPGLPIGIVEPALAKEFIPENVPCLRGPCRHYFHCSTHFDIQNPKGTFEEGEEPQKHLHYCTSMPGTELELSADSPIYSCSHWDPKTAKEVAEVKARREAYNEAWHKMPGHNTTEGQDDTATTGDGPD